MLLLFCSENAFVILTSYSLVPLCFALSLFFVAFFSGTPGAAEDAAAPPEVADVPDDALDPALAIIQLARLIPEEALLVAGA